MDNMRNELLTVDGIINLGLGVLLIWFPPSVVEALGVPGQEGAFYANILGGILFGVGVALLIERFRPPLRAVGLGLAGAITINLAGAVVLAAWLVFGKLTPSTLGSVLLWAMVIVLVGLSGAELQIQQKLSKSS